MPVVTLCVRAISLQPGVALLVQTKGSSASAHAQPTQRCLGGCTAPSCKNMKVASSAAGMGALTSGHQETQDMLILAVIERKRTVPDLRALCGGTLRRTSPSGHQETQDMLILAVIERERSSPVSALCSRCTPSRQWALGSSWCAGREGDACNRGFKAHAPIGACCQKMPAQRALITAREHTRHHYPVFARSLEPCSKRVLQKLAAPESSQLQG
eukprot:1136530-Pelagomonas_calceolata.AAC.4